MLSESRRQYRRNFDFTTGRAQTQSLIFPSGRKKRSKAPRSAMLSTNLGYAGQIFIIGRVVLEAIIETKIFTLILSDELYGIKGAVMVFV